ncbi:hypothetical protein JOE50_002450 [Bradyrhizobium japonicum]|nr:hypothetical protein [Bradyrhizobium japonicum]
MARCITGNLATRYIEGRMLHVHNVEVGGIKRDLFRKSCLQDLAVVVGMDIA